jgi:DNA-binding transcriptional ArsR family regulator
VKPARARLVEFGRMLQDERRLVLIWTLKHKTGAGGSMTAAGLARDTKLSRQIVAQHLRLLVASGILEQRTPEPTEYAINPLLTKVIEGLSAFAWQAQDADVLGDLIPLDTPHRVALGSLSPHERDLALAAAGRGLAHPLRVRITSALLAREREMSPLELAAEFDESLNAVSYHVRYLRDVGCIELTRVTPAGGAHQHFYGLADNLVEILKLVRLVVLARQPGETDVAEAAVADASVKLGKGLAQEPSRRIIFELVGSDTALTVQDLSTRLDLPKSGVRHHVKTLRKLGFVAAEGEPSAHRKGSERRYALVGRMRALASYVAGAEQVASAPDAKGDG